MTPPPNPRPDLTGSIAAMFGGMLCALLAALLGVVRRRAQPCDAAGADLLSAVLRAEVEAETTAEPWVEWIAVPAPWRGGRHLPRAHASAPARQHGVRPAARTRGPPAQRRTTRHHRTGIA